MTTASDLPEPKVCVAKAREYMDNAKEHGVLLEVIQANVSDMTHAIYAALYVIAQNTAPKTDD